MASAIHGHELETGIQVAPPSWTPLPSSSPPHPSRQSQSTSFVFPVSHKLPLAIYFTYGYIYMCVSMLFSQIIPPSSSPTATWLLMSHLNAQSLNFLVYKLAETLAWRTCVEMKWYVNMWSLYTVPSWGRGKCRGNSRCNPQKGFLTCEQANSSLLFIRWEAQCRRGSYQRSFTPLPLWFVDSVPSPLPSMKRADT